jgi:hypothetical protein
MWMHASFVGARWQPKDPADSFSSLLFVLIVLMTQHTTLFKLPSPSSSSLDCLGCPCLSRLRQQYSIPFVGHSVFFQPRFTWCRLPPDKRKIPLATIAACTQLDIDGVEFLLMRAMSLKLVTGTIDEIEAVVDIRHLQPRVLTVPEIDGLKSNVEGWIKKVDGAAALLDKEGIGAVEALA